MTIFISLHEPGDPRVEIRLTTKQLAGVVDESQTFHKIIGVLESKRQLKEYVIQDGEKSQ